MQRADKNYKDLKQKQKSVIADKTYSMYSDFSLLQVTLPEVHLSLIHISEPTRP